MALPLAAMAVWAPAVHAQAEAGGAAASSGGAPGSAAGSVPAAPGATAAPAQVTPSITPSTAGAWTPSYEVGGIGRRGGREGGVLTDAVVGTAIRFDNGVFVYVDGGGALGYDSNVAAVSTGAVSSSLLTLKPRVVAEARTATNRFTLTYLGDYVRFVDAASEDFANHDLKLAGDIHFSPRERAAFSATLQDRTDPRGTTSRLISVEPDRWQGPTVRGLYIYGSRGAIGRVEVDASHQRKRYQNNRATTALADVDVTGLTGRFFYRFRPLTLLLAEARVAREDYASTLSTSDNTDVRLLVGATWEGTAKTRGSVKLGWQHKNFSAGTRASDSSLTYEGSVEFTPLSYSRFAVDLLRAAQGADAAGLGSITRTSANRLSWTHNWRSYFATRLSYERAQNGYPGVRTDTIATTAAGLVYDFSAGRYRVGLDIRQAERSSTLAAARYSRNTAVISLDVAL